MLVKNKMKQMKGLTDCKSYWSILIKNRINFMSRENLISQYKI